jgi:hypothetical protein
LGVKPINKQTIPDKIETIDPYLRETSGDKKRSALKPCVAARNIGLCPAFLPAFTSGDSMHDKAKSYLPHLINCTTFVAMNDSTRQPTLLRSLKKTLAKTDMGLYQKYFEHG